jgi:hypothetical protein
MCSGRVNSSCSNSDTRHVNLATNPVISHEQGKNREVFTRSGIHPWSLVTQIFHNRLISNVLQSPAWLGLLVLNRTTDIFRLYFRARPFLVHDLHGSAKISLDF